MLTDDALEGELIHCDGPVIHFCEHAFRAKKRFDELNTNFSLLLCQLRLLCSIMLNDGVFLAEGELPKISHHLHDCKVCSCTCELRQIIIIHHVDHKLSFEFCN